MLILLYVFISLTLDSESCSEHIRPFESQFLHNLSKWVCQKEMIDVGRQSAQMSNHHSARLTANLTTNCNCLDIKIYTDS